MLVTSPPACNDTLFTDEAGWGGGASYLCIDDYMAIAVSVLGIESVSSYYFMPMKGKGPIEG